MATADYFVSSTVWSALGFTFGFMVGTGYKVRFLPNKLTERKRDRMLGATLILISLIATAQSLIFQRHQRSVTECQVRYNSQFQQILKDRTSIADRDRKNTNDMVRTVLGATSRETVRAALERYVRTNDELSKERAKNPFPGNTSEDCK